MNMELEIQKEKREPLLKMTELKVRISFEGATPKREVVAREVAMKKKSKEDLIIIQSIKTLYGEQAAIVTARIYENRKALELVEQKSLLKKHAKQPLEKSKKEESADEKKPESPESEKEKKKGDDEALESESSGSEESKIEDKPEKKNESKKNPEKESENSSEKDSKKDKKSEEGAS